MMDGVGVGVIALGETLNAHGPAIFALTAAVLAVIVATWALARGSAATMAARTGRDVQISDQPAMSSDG
jgi:hypothetical protein